MNEMGLPSKTLAAAALFALLAGHVNLRAPAQTRVPGTEETAAPLLLGQSLPLSGPSGRLGQAYLSGAQAWFSEINRRGGIHGRRIRLISLDDQYEPDQTLRNTRQLLDQKQVLKLCPTCEPAIALFGYVGTPTTKVVLPMIQSRGVPLVAPMTGASLLRQPSQQMVFNLRASYRMEIDAIVNNLVRDARHRIAIVYQNDAFGEDGLNATLDALKSHDLQPVTITTVERNSDRVEKAVADLMKASPAPNGVVIISAYVSSAALSRDLLNRGLKAQLMNVSFVGTKALQDAMPVGQSNGIGVAQVVPFPWNRWIPVVAEYQRLMRLNTPNPSFSFASLEGFLAAQLMTEGLQRAGTNPSRERLLQALESIRGIDLGGFRMDLSEQDHQASDFVELTFLGSQRWEP